MYLGNAETADGEIPMDRILYELNENFPEGFNAIEGTTFLKRRFGYFSWRGTSTKREIYNMLVKSGLAEKETLSEGTKNDGTKKIKYKYTLIDEKIPTPPQMGDRGYHGIAELPDSKRLVLAYSNLEGSKDFEDTILKNEDFIKRMLRIKDSDSEYYKSLGGVHLDSIHSED